jgi:hypothetical protein
MLMFDNGLLTTFIPEILMVLGYLLCLISPQFKHEKEIYLQNSVSIEVAPVQHQQLSTYQIQTSDFYSNNVEIEKTDYFGLNPKGFSTFFLPHQKPKLSDELGFRQFSRPPPVSVC